MNLLSQHRRLSVETLFTAESALPLRRLRKPYAMELTAVTSRYARSGKLLLPRHIATEAFRQPQNTLETHQSKAVKATNSGLKKLTSKTRNRWTPCHKNLKPDYSLNLNETTHYRVALHSSDPERQRLVLSHQIY